MITTKTTSPLTIIDQTDSRKLEVYIKSNLPTMQIHNSNSGAYTPDWSEGEGLKLSADVFLESRNMSDTEYNNTSIKWYKNEIKEDNELKDAPGDAEDITSDKRTVIIKTNVLEQSSIVTYICEATYQGITASSRITFARVDTGRNGEKGADGTSVRILGNAKSVDPVEGTSYYTITYDAGAIVAAALGDAYVYGGELYVCSVLNGGRDGTTDHFVNVGAIQGEAAKSLTLLGNAQVLHIDKDGVFSPSTIDITAHTVNFTNEQKSSIVFEYRTTTNGVWSNITGGMISVINNVIRIDGDAFKGFSSSDFVSIRATFEDGDETYQDVFTVYKTFDGADGEKGDPAPIAFLSNEHISFAANANGIVNEQTVYTSVIGYVGDKRKKPTIGDLSVTNAGLEVIGMKVEIDEEATSKTDPEEGEVILKISVDAKVNGNANNLGSALSKSDSFSIPVTSPADVALQLNWTKINAGVDGEAGVGINSINVKYGTTDSSSARPADDKWYDEIPDVPEGHYLWTRTTIDYTDSNRDDTVTYTYVKQGEKGDTGTSVSVTEVRYAVHNSASTPPSKPIEEWSHVVVGTDPTNPYLWTRTIFSDGKYADSVARYGTDGFNFRTFTTKYEANQTNIDNWSKMESTEWNVNESTSGVMVGDTVMLRCYNTTKQGYSYILATVISIPGDKVIHSKSTGLLDKGDAGINAYTVLLTNESHVFAGDIANAIAGEASTQVIAYVGATSQNVTIVSVDGVNASTSATNTKTTGLTFQCDMLTGTSPKITFKCTTSFVNRNGAIPIIVKVGGLTFTKMFTYSIAFKGNTGTASSSYWLVSNASAVQKTSSGDILCTPETLTFTGRIQTGTSAPTNYACRWIIATSTDGSTYTDAYTSSANEATKSFATSATYKAIRIRMYLAGGTTTLLDEQIIPFVSDGETGAVGATGDNAVTFQVYSNNGYALSTSTPTLLLQTFAYFGDVEITAGATYQWYRHNNTDWVAVSGATNAYFNVSRDDVSFSNNYMCKMQFNGTEYVGVVTVDDKNDENRVFASKPSNYFAGDLWIVGTDYIPPGRDLGTMLRAEHTNTGYVDSDWVPATKYDSEINELKSTVDSYKQYFSVNETNGFQIDNTTINNNILTTNRVEASTINAISSNTEMLNVTGKYSGSTMLQAPIINLGNFSLVIENNGSLSIVANV